jgi:Xaa-Pro aminopeptidase
MRLVKDAGEIATMRRAARISAAAHLRAMRACRIGMREYEIEAELLHEFRRRRPPIRRWSPQGATPACCTTRPAMRN